MKQGALREIPKWRCLAHQLRFVVAWVVLLRDEAVVVACVEPYEASRDVEVARCCSRAGGGEAEDRMRRAEVDPGRSAGSAMKAMVDEVWARSIRWHAVAIVGWHAHHAGRRRTVGTRRTHSSTWIAMRHRWWRRRAVMVHAYGRTARISARR